MSPTYKEFLSDDAHRPGVLLFGGARMALLDIEAGFWGLHRQMEALVGQRLTDSVLQQAGANGGASFARAFLGERPAADGAQALRDCIGAYQAAGFGRFEIETLEWPFDLAQGKPVGRLVIRGIDAFEAWMMRQHAQEEAEGPVCAYSAGKHAAFANEAGLLSFSRPWVQMPEGEALRGEWGETVKKRSLCHDPPHRRHG